MKSLFVSTLTAILFALPLGIGGLTFTAPVFATSAEANAFVRWIREQHQRTRHHFDTCSNSVIWECHSRIHTLVLFDGRVGSIYTSRQLPHGSDGADQAAYDWLSARARGEGISRSTFAAIAYAEARDLVFPNGSPAEVAAREAEAARRVEEARRRLEEAPEISEDTPSDELPLGIRVARCEAQENHVWNNGECHSLGPSRPYGEQVSTVRPLRSLAEIVEIGAHRQVTSDNRSEIVELQQEVNSYGNALARLGDNLALAMGGLATLAEIVDENRKGIALSYALGNVPTVISSISRGAVSGGVGHFEDENAVAFGLTYKFTPRLTGNVGAGFETGKGNSVTGARAGLVWEFGHFGNRFLN